MNNELYGDLSIISTKGNEDFALQVDNWIRQWRYEEAVSKTQELGGGDTTLFDTDISVDSFLIMQRQFVLPTERENVSFMNLSADMMFIFCVIYLITVLHIKCTGLSIE